MNKVSFITITIIYMLILFLYNYSLYKLLTFKSFGHQYYLIFIYFFAEIFNFILYWFFKKKDIIIGDIHPYIYCEMSDDMALNEISNQTTSNITNTNNELQNSHNSGEIINTSNTSSNLSLSNSDIIYSNSIIPYVAVKINSFVLSGFLDFVSKIFIFNGIKYMHQESIIRCLIELVLLSIGSKYCLNAKISNILLYLSIGILMIVIYIILYFLYPIIKEQYFGFLLFGEGAVLTCAQYLLHVKFFQKGELYILRIVSWEGIFGTIFSAILVFASIYLECPFLNNTTYHIDKDKSSVDKMPIDNNTEYLFFCNGNTLESNLMDFFGDLQYRWGWFLFYFLSCLFYSFIGVFITKSINVVYRVSLDTCRMMLFIIIGIVFNKQDTD